MPHSITSIHNFRKCKLFYKLKHLDYVPEGKKSDAAERGTFLHGEAEHFVMGTKALHPELNSFNYELHVLRGLYAEGRASLEGDWGYTNDMIATPWKQRYVGMKLDAIAFSEDKTYAVIIDYKTGRKHGNEIKHGEQLQFYAVGAFNRYHELEELTAELYYIDQDDITKVRFTRPQAMRFMPRWQKEMATIDATKEFPASPNIISCKWCPYGPDGTGHCGKGLSKQHIINLTRKKTK